MEVRASWFRVGAAVAVAVLLAGCGGGSSTPEPGASPGATPPSSTAEPTPDATATATSTPTGASSPTASPTPTSSATAFPADTETDVEEPSGDATATLTGISVRTGPGYEEIVFTETGGRMGWFVGYTDDPRSDGSGDPVAVAGDEALEVRLRGITAPFEDDASRDTVDPDTGDAEYIAEIIDDAWFEGQWTFFVGLDQRRAFRMFRGDDGNVHLQIATG